MTPEEEKKTDHEINGCFRGLFSACLLIGFAFTTGLYAGQYFERLAAIAANAGRWVAEPSTGKVKFEYGNQNGESK